MLRGWTDDAIDDLLDIVRAFTRGELPATEYERLFRGARNSTPEGDDHPMSALLDDVWFACEAYVENPSLRDPDDVDDARLLEVSTAALRAWDDYRLASKRRARRLRPGLTR